MPGAHADWRAAAPGAGRPGTHGRSREVRRTAPSLRVAGTVGGGRSEGREEGDWPGTQGPTAGGPPGGFSRSFDGRLGPLHLPGPNLTQVR